MRPMTIALLAVPVVVLGASTGCAAPTEPVAEPVARLIVRFRPGVSDPASAPSLSALARRADVADLALLRPMSGDAYVLTMRCSGGDVAGAADPCTAALARLAAVDIVLSVEIDGRAGHR